MNKFITKEQFYDKYNVFEYNHKLGHQIVVVNKNNNMIEYIDEGKNLDNLYNNLFFNLNVVNYINYNNKNDKVNNNIDLEEFYKNNFETWEPLADIYEDELVQWNYAGRGVVFKMYVKKGNKNKYTFYQKVGSSIYTEKEYKETLINPSEQELKDTVNEYLLRYMGAIVYPNSPRYL